MAHKMRPGLGGGGGGGELEPTSESDWPFFFNLKF